MAFEPTEKPDMREYGGLPDGGTSITAWFPVGARKLADCDLLPGDLLPRDSDAGIFGSGIRRSEGIRHAVVVAHKADYYHATAQTRSGTATAAATTITATAPIFYPSLVGQTVTFNSIVYTVATYVSPTVITVTASATATSKAITFTEGSRRLNEIESDTYQHGADRRWSGVRRYHCLPADRHAETAYLKTTAFVFEADTNSVSGVEVTVMARGRDPLYKHRSVIEVTYVAADYLYSAAQTRAGVATAATTTITATAPIFYPSLVGQTVTFNGTARTVASYVSPTVITITESATATSKAITFTEGSRLLSEMRSDAYRWVKNGKWTVTRKYHCLTADRDAEAMVLAARSYVFLADPAAIVGQAAGLVSIGKDPNFPSKSIIEVVYQSDFNPVEYPTTYATQEMYTTQDTKKLLYDLTTGTPLAIETEPDKDGYYTAVEKGTNIVIDPRVVFVIRTAIARASLDYKDLAEYAGKGNEGAFTYIANGVATHTMLCMKLATAPDFIDDGSQDYVPVMFVFGYYKEGLDGYCVARQRRRWVKQEPVRTYDEDPDSVTEKYVKKGGGTTATAAEGRMREVVKDEWAKKSAADEVTARVMFEFVDFSTIDALLNW